jgi:hypothetical protein
LTEGGAELDVLAANFMVEKGLIVGRVFSDPNTGFIDFNEWPAVLGGPHNEAREELLIFIIRIKLRIFQGSGLRHKTYH